MARPIAGIAWGTPSAHFTSEQYPRTGHSTIWSRHTPDPDQTATLCSSVDPWHQPSDISDQRDQVGFDLFHTSGYTRGLPAMIPVAMLYGTPEDSASQLAYLKKRGYPISYVEMGEEPDGQYMLPEQYGALYLQWATALRQVDPALNVTPCRFIPALTSLVGYSYPFQRTRRVVPARCPGRVLLARVPLGQTPSLHPLRRRLLNLVRGLLWLYEFVRLPAFVHHRRASLDFPMRPLAFFCLG